MIHEGSSTFHGLRKRNHNVPWSEIS